MARQQLFQNPDIEEEYDGADHMEFCCNFGDRHEYNSRLAHDLIANRCYWSGNCCCDYLFHVANRHPLISCACCHPMHPYSKCERTAVLIIVSALTLFPSAALTSFLNKHLNEAADAADASTVQGTDTAAEVLLFFNSKTWFLLLLGVTIPVMILQVILERLMVLDVYFNDHRRRKYIGPVCRCIVAFINLMKNCCLLIVCLVVTVVILCSVGVVSLGDFGKEGKEIQPFVTATMMPFIPWAISRGQSWLLWFPLDFFMPCCGFAHMFYSEKSDFDVGIIPEHLEEDSDHDSK